MKREWTIDIKHRYGKYFAHIKIHNTLIKTNHMEEKVEGRPAGETTIRMGRGYQ